ncbi:MAG: hypothetical protein SPE09_03450 [Alloprevotella sp.]|nr:hypothetical protein [Bacteroidales bacterium]MDY4557706.1 hypothetical protein [Alloprevotella sp.]
MKSLGFSFSLPSRRLSWRSKVCKASAKQNEKPCKVREKKEKPQGFAISFPNCRRLYSKAVQSERKERKKPQGFAISFPN